MTTPTTVTPTAAPIAASPTARRRRLAALAVLAAAGIGALTACGTDYPLAPTAPRQVDVAPVAAAAGDAGAASGTVAPGPAASGPGPSGPAASGSTGGRGASPAGTGGRTGGSSQGGAPGGSQTGGSQTGGSQTGGSQPGGATGGNTGGGPVAAPAIASFRVVSQPVCAVHGTPDAPFSTPGQGVTIAWSVTGADGAALAVDNPTTYGAYGTSYPAKGQQEFPFTCDAGGTTTHTFTVWPAGAKGTSKTLTVTARSDG